MGVPKIIRKIVPSFLMYQYDRYIQHRTMHSTLTLEQWLAQGRPIPAPPVVKRAAMVTYKERYGATWFVETGTFMGDTTNAMKDVFERVDSCELDQKLAERATQLFKPYANVRIWQGNSGQKIKDILATIPPQTICLFWLDGHFSGGVTAKADKNTPISEEIDAIYAHGKHHVIFVDDARMFLNKIEDYPPLDDLTAQVKHHLPEAVIAVEDDIIRITPY